MSAIDPCFSTWREILRPRIWWLILAMAGLLPLGGFGDEFETANQHYDQGEFKEAKQGYEKVVGVEGGNANVFYNLGNTEFRLESSGRAILNYERALALDPHHPEARANLSLLRERTGAKLLPAWWGRTIAVNLAPKAWSMAAAVSGWVVLFGLVLLCTSRGETRFSVWMVTLLGAVVCAVAGVALWSIAMDQSLGIITAPEAQARLAPAESAGVAAALPAGSQVRVLSERGDWIYCEMPNASRGWIASDAVEKVRPSKS